MPTKTAKPSRRSKNYPYPARADETPRLDPDHPNFDTILLRRAKLDARRLRTQQNRPNGPLR